MENLAKYVKEMRKFCNLTQQTLAMYVGVSTKFIIQLERGKKTLRLDKVLQVLEFFDATLEVKDLSTKREETILY